MRLFFTTVWANITQAIRSTGFLISVAGTFMAVALGTTGLPADSADVIYLLGLSLNGSSSIILVVCIFSILPFATSFASEWTERSYRFWVIRTGLRVYSYAKIVVCAVSGFLATFVGLTIFLGAFSLLYPLFVSPYVSNGYSIFLENGQPYLYLLFFMTHISLSSSIFAVLALFVSSIFQDRFTTVAMPVVIYMAALRLFELIAPPAFLNLSVLIEAIYNAGSPLKSILLKLTATIIVILVSGGLTSMRIRKLVQND